MRDITLTLSRWHHVAQRLRVSAQKLTDEAYATLAETRISSPIDEDQKQAMKTEGQRALQKTQEIMQAHKGLGLIRGELAKANATFGVSDKMAVVESLRHEKAQLQRLAQIKLLTMPSVDNANDALEKRKTENQPMRYRAGDENDGLALRVVSIDALESANNRVQHIEGLILSLTDEISDINRQTLTISLDDAIAKLVHLD